MAMYRDFTAGIHQNLKFYPGLVLGWLVQSGDMEVRYALYSNGRVLRADPAPIFGPGSDEFAPKGRKWTKIDEVPGNAEFIGNYKPPALLPKRG